MKCYVCSDPHRKEIEEYFLKTKNVKYTLEWAKNNFDTKITYYSLYKHIKNHFVSIIEASKKASKLRTEVIKRDIYQDLEISKTLTTNLKRLNEQLESLQPDSSKSRSEIRNIITKINSTIELILKFKSDLDLETISSEEELENKILYCIEDFPVEYKEIFLKRWDMYESKKSSS